jgi:hypothetical protein
MVRGTVATSNGFFGSGALLSAPPSLGVEFHDEGLAPALGAGPAS